MSDTNKIKTYEIFTTKYSVIIQAHNVLEAIFKFYRRYDTEARIIQIVDVDFFKLKAIK